MNMDAKIAEFEKREVEIKNKIIALEVMEKKQRRQKKIAIGWGVLVSIIGVILGVVQIYDSYYAKKRDRRDWVEMKKNQFWTIVKALPEDDSLYNTNEILYVMRLGDIIDSEADAFQPSDFLAAGKKFGQMAEHLRANRYLKEAYDGTKNLANSEYPLMPKVTIFRHYAKSCFGLGYIERGRGVRKQSIDLTIDSQDPFYSNSVTAQSYELWAYDEVSAKHYDKAFECYLEAAQRYKNANDNQKALEMYKKLVGNEKFKSKVTENIRKCYIEIAKIESD